MYRRTPGPSEGLGRPTPVVPSPAMPRPKRCCRSCPRCDDCPAVAAVAARARRQETATAALVGEVLGGTATRRELPEPVTRALEALAAARRGGATTASCPG